VEVTGTGSRWDSAGFLYVGYTGTGTLDVNDGGRVTSEYGAIAADPNSVGTATITGTDSQWTLSEGLAVGAFGQGDLIISAGGLVDANEAYIGGFDTDVLGGDANDVPQGTGTVTVTGTGSQLDVADFLYLGYTGTGTLDVNDGGLVASAYGGIGADPNSTGTATVTGTDSQWALSEGLAVGAYGQGDLIISAGGLVDAKEVYIGGFDTDVLGGDANDVPQGTGTVTVTGTGSQLDVADYLYVGYSGTGTLDVNDGGLASVSEVSVGELASGTGTVEVTGVGSQLTASSGLRVGRSGDGTVRVSEGGVVNVDGALTIGDETDANGVVEVTDAGSEVTVAYSLNVGDDGQGTLTVSEGGQVNGEGIVYMGRDSASTGTVEVTGTGSVLDVSSTLYVGYSGDANMVVSDGGLVQSGEATVGYEASSVGEVTVTGTGSTWTASEQSIGRTGEGHLTIREGGASTSTSAILGQMVGGSGEVLVTGSGSQWDISNTLWVGYRGEGELVIADGAQVSSRIGILGEEAMATGIVTVTGESSEWVLADDLCVGYAGTGILDVNDGASLVVDESLYIGGDEEDRNGTGTLMVNGGAEVLVGEELYVWGNGTLGGDGTISIWEPTTLHNYGTIAPGDDGIGTLTVEGNVVFEPNSVYAVQIDNSNADKLLVDGDVTINGGTVQVSSEGTVVGSREYDILDANSITGTFDTLDTALLDFYFNDIGLNYETSSVVLWIDAMRFDDPNVAQTYNQQEVGGAFQEIAGGGGNSITTALQALPEFDDVRQAYDQLSGQTRPSLAPITVAGTARFLGTVSNRLRNPGSVLASGGGGSSLSAQAGPDTTYSSTTSYEISTNGYNLAVGNGSPYLSDSKWGFWGKGYGLFGSRDDESEAPGYDYTTYGAGFGLDYQFTDTTLVGLTVGYSDGDVNYDGLRDNSELSGTHFGLYGSWDTAGRYLDLDSYTESGGTAALGYEGQSYESYIGALGMKLTKDLLKDEAEKSLVVQLRARWLHEFGDTRSDVDTYFATDPTVVFNVRDNDIARDSAVLGVGLGAQLNRRTRLYADYDTRLNADDTAHLISAGLQYRW